MGFTLGQQAAQSTQITGTRHSQSVTVAPLTPTAAQYDPRDLEGALQALRSAIGESTSGIAVVLAGVQVSIDASNNLVASAVWSTYP